MNILLCHEHHQTINLNQLPSPQQIERTLYVTNSLRNELSTPQRIERTLYVTNEQTALTFSAQRTK